ncbi:MAG: thiamine pyrophosphate-requiring protein [bacterium]
MTQKKITVDTTAEAYLALLGDRGIDYFFGNGGTDFASIIEGLAKLKAEGRPAPKPLLVPHEMAAMSMAHGYTMVTGRPQLVMVHVTVGTANSLTGIINAMRSKIPMLFSAGRTPITESGVRGSRSIFIHWAQESFDQGGMTREFVKWDYELRNFEQLETVVDRALSIASANPKGPVSLVLPREVLAAPQKEFSYDSPSRIAPSPRAYPDLDAVDRAAEMLANAAHPVILVAEMGRQTASVGELVALAEAGAFPVIEPPYRAYMNFPTNHPLHQGFDIAGEFDKADVILILESDVPWIPSLVQPRRETKFIHLGGDPYYKRYPIRSFPIDLAIETDPAVGLAALREALAPRLAGREDALAEKRKDLAAAHKDRREEQRSAAVNASRANPIDYAWLSHCIGEAVGESAIIVNEYDLVPQQVERTQPGTFFDHPPAAGLGWGLGAGLGAKLAAPERTVAVTVGDGAYIFGNPVAAHWTSNAHNLPVLFIVFNNGTWGSVKRSARGLHPDGWAAGQDDFAFTSLEPSPAFEKICEASGGYGERVEDPGDVGPALERALRSVREDGRQALLNVICEKP